MKVKAVILGADNGMRMQNHIPKILQPICGIPLIKYLINSAKDAGINDITVVTSPDNENIAPLVAPHPTVIQKKRNGTGNAVLMAEPYIQPFDGCVVILLGDAPLIRPETIKSLIERYNAGSDVSVLAFIPSDARRYGRLIMGEDGLEKIVEYKDATDQERTIRLCNSGIMCVNGKYLLELVKQIRNNNAAEEYYLTDIVALAKKQGLKLDVIMGNVEELHGINTQEELEAAEELFLKCKIRTTHE